MENQMSDTNDFVLLNDKFGIENELKFSDGPGGLPVIEISNSLADAAIALHGAHVMHYQPAGAEPVLWMSEHSYFAPGKPIRGGIPVCWPWFGSPPGEVQVEQSHGFARNSDNWQVVSARHLNDGGTQVVFSLEDDEATRKIWPYTFKLEYKVTVGKKLCAELTTSNTGKEDFTITQALHSYFKVSEISDVEVAGLDGCKYFDTLFDPFKSGCQQGPLSFRAETDLIFVDMEAECTITDPGLNRKIKIGKCGSRGAVVWNPWIDKSIRMPDFGREEYHSMLCIETTNVADDKVTVKAGKSHTIAAIISAE